MLTEPFEQPSPLIDIENDVYHADTSRISKSGCDKIEESPADYYECYLNPDREKPTTKALRFGSIIHCAILEPNDFTKHYAVEPANAPYRRPTLAMINAKKPAEESIKAIEWWREFDAKHVGKTFVTAKEFEQAERITAAVHANPTAALLLAKGQAEKALYWNDYETGAPCKMKMDFLSEQNFIADIKTTEDASPKGFGKSAFNYRYDVAGAYYTDGYFENFGQSIGFAFIAVEKKAPYKTACYYLQDIQAEIGRDKYHKNLKTYMECLETGDWPGFSQKLEPLEFPTFALKRF